MSRPNRTRAEWALAYLNAELPDAVKRNVVIDWSLQELAKRVIATQHVPEPCSLSDLRECFVAATTRKKRRDRKARRRQEWAELGKGFQPMSESDNNERIDRIRRTAQHSMEQVSVADDDVLWLIARLDEAEAERGKTETLLGRAAEFIMEHDMHGEREEKLRDDIRAWIANEKAPDAGAEGKR